MDTLKLHTEPLQDAWLDLYGHLNEAYYLVPFSNASWKLQDHFGIGGGAYFDQTGCALYTVETHIRYLCEVRKPALMDVETIIIGSDAERIWFAHQMLVDGTLRATGEFMGLHYDTKEGCITSMPDATQAQLKNAEIAEQPDWIGSNISL